MRSVRWQPKEGGSLGIFGRDLGERREAVTVPGSAEREPLVGRAVGASKPLEVDVTCRWRSTGHEERENDGRATDHEQLRDGDGDRMRGSGDVLQPRGSKGERPIISLGKERPASSACARSVL